MFIPDMEDVNNFLPNCSVLRGKIRRLIEINSDIENIEMLLEEEVKLRQSQIKRKTFFSIGGKKSPTSRKFRHVCADGV